MTWFWLTFPLASLFFLAATVIPPWLVIKDPDTRRKTSGPARRAADRTFAAPVPVQAVNSAASPPGRKRRKRRGPTALPGSKSWWGAPADELRRSCRIQKLAARPMSNR
jgi:hypothetical protein